VLPYFVPSYINPTRTDTGRSNACARPEGFTQAELIVAILVVGILAAIAAPSFSQWLRQKQVDAAFNQIEFALQETQIEAVKRHQTCHLDLARGSDPTLTGNCLVTGDRILQGITLDHSRPSNGWIISFNENGENRSVSNDPGTLWLSSTDGNVRSKCLVISVGIGLRRSGQYKNDSCITP
jgi:prepilin-type N-terminal cleavage/methylation domain-containing protein